MKLFVYSYSTKSSRGLCYVQGSISANSRGEAIAEIKADDPDIIILTIEEVK